MISSFNSNQNYNLERQRQLQQQDSPVKGKFVKEFFLYAQLRFRQIRLFSFAAYMVVSSVLSDFKAWTVRRMFWGRSSLYRSSFHTIVSVITIIAVLSGLSQRLNVSKADNAGLDVNTGIIGRQDVFSQSGTSESFGPIGEDYTDYSLYKYKVQSGDTISKIAEIFKISQNTIRWANSLKSDTLSVGQILRIPGIDGAFIKVAEGDTLDSIAKKYNGVVANIVDLNTNVINPLDPKIKVGMELFIPFGVIPTPPPVVAYYPSSNYIAVGNAGGIDVAPGTFVHPLGTDGGCSGWTWSRGFTSYHGGVDMAKKGGCWINAASSGTVTKAGWGSGGEGYHVVIDHGNGIKTLYYHGSGSFAVSTGQQVKAGQKIMYMGSTGNSTGTHLHFEFRINDIKVNPELYVDLR